MWKQKIKTLARVPDNLSSGEFDNDWVSASKHSYRDKNVPLESALAFMHGSGLFTLTAGATAWIAERLKDRTDVSELEDLSEALFAYQVSNDYFEFEHKMMTEDEIDELDRAEATVRYIIDHHSELRLACDDEWPGEPIVETAKETIMLARHNIPRRDREAFDNWVKAVVDRLHSLVPFPGYEGLLDDPDDDEIVEQVRLMMGRPLPPHVLDVTSNVDPQKLDSQVSEFLSSVNWRENRMLRSPEGVRAHGNLKSIYGDKE